MKNNVLSKQKKTIIILSSLALILLIVYLAVIIFAKAPLNTVLKYDSDGDAVYATVSDTGNNGITASLLTGYLESGEKNKYDVKPGETEEVYYTFRAPDIQISYRPFIFPEVPLENLKSVKLQNGADSYTIIRQSDGTYSLDGCKKAVFDSQTVSNLVFQARYMLSQQKLENASDDLSEYGLSESDKPVYITVTDTDGNSNTVLLGNKSTTGSYYMKHRDKPYVYIADSSVSVLASDVTALLSPVLEQTLSENEYNYMESFSMKKGGIDFIKCAIVAQEQSGSSSALHKLTYPANYSASMEYFYNAMSDLSSPKGDAVLEYDVSSNPKKQEMFDFYGFTVPSNEISYSVGDKNCHFITGNSFTLSDGEKYYYAYSEYADTVVTLKLSSMPFLEYELIDFVDSNIFRNNIENISSISVSTPAGTKTFDLSGSGQELTVTERQSGKLIDTQSFRQMYISLLSITVEGYSEICDASLLTHDLSFTVETKSGDKNTYSFYSLSTLRCFMTVDGSGEFYTNRAYIDKISKNVDMLMSGTEIKADY